MAAAFLYPNSSLLEPVAGSQTPEIPKIASSSASASNVRILEATLADAPALASLGIRTFTASFGHSVSPDDLAGFLGETYSAEAFQSEMRSPQVVTWAAKDPRGTVLGLAQLVRGMADDVCLGSEDPAEHPAELAQLHRLYVDTSVHGRGIGSRMLAVAEDRARAEGFKKLWLTVWEENTGAQRLYERYGFAKVGEIDFVIGKCVQRDWCLVKELRQ